MTKQQARAEAKRRRSGLEPAALGAAYAAVLITLPAWQSADTLLAFAALPDEPDTTPLLQLALAQGKRLLLPRVVGKTAMEWVPVADLAALRPATMGILEPTGPALPTADFPTGAACLALVPCLAADRTGVRLGRGGGYYDRFLAHYKGNKFLICPHALLFDALPSERHDIRFSPAEILTEKGILTP